MSIRAQHARLCVVSGSCLNHGMLLLVTAGTLLDGCSVLLPFVAALHEFEKEQH